MLLHQLSLPRQFLDGRNRFCSQFRRAFSRSIESFLTLLGETIRRCAVREDVLHEVDTELVASIMQKHFNAQDGGFVILAALHRMVWEEPQNRLSRTWRNCIWSLLRTLHKKKILSMGKSILLDRSAWMELFDQHVDEIEKYARAVQFDRLRMLCAWFETWKKSAFSFVEGTVPFHKILQKYGLEENALRALDAIQSTLSRQKGKQMSAKGQLEALKKDIDVDDFVLAFRRQFLKRCIVRIQTPLFGEKKEYICTLDPSEPTQPIDPFFHLSLGMAALIQMRGKHLMQFKHRNMRRVYISIQKLRKWARDSKERRSRDVIVKDVVERVILREKDHHFLRIAFNAWRRKLTIRWRSNKLVHSIHRISTSQYFQRWRRFTKRRTMDQQITFVLSRRVQLFKKTFFYQKWKDAHSKIFQFLGILSREVDTGLMRRAFSQWKKQHSLLFLASMDNMRRPLRSCWRRWKRLFGRRRMESVWKSLLKATYERKCFDRMISLHSSLKLSRLQRNSSLLRKGFNFWKSSLHYRWHWKKSLSYVLHTWRRFVDSKLKDERNRVLSCRYFRDIILPRRIKSMFQVWRKMAHREELERRKRAELIASFRVQHFARLAHMILQRWAVICRRKKTIEKQNYLVERWRTFCLLRHGLRSFYVNVISNQQHRRNHKVGDVICHRYFSHIISTSWLKWKQNTCRLIALKEGLSLRYWILSLLRKNFLRWRLWHERRIQHENAMVAISFKHFILLRQHAFQRWKFRTFQEARVRRLLAVEFDRRRVLRQTLAKLKSSWMKKKEEHAKCLLRMNLFILKRYLGAWRMHVAEKRNQKTLLFIRTLALMEGSFRMWKAWVHHRAIERVQICAIRSIRRKSILGRHFYLWKSSTPLP
eukprot:TRINITY_DN1896_c0_g1_i1.p1 TRINITY_DN1896_c0_g1~~TRINITY_DN1896_c0_g1_i1.p1  ORF type:complete len:876 (+),score=218.29 TRINITY_DN1896_c0_g1_i1:183-2810(+)